MLSIPLSSSSRASPVLVIPGILSPCHPGHPPSSSSRAFPVLVIPGILSPCHPERSEGSFSVPVSSCRENRSFVAAAPQDDRGGGTPQTSGIAAVLLYTVRRLSFWALLCTVLGISLSSSFRVFPCPRHPGHPRPCHPERSEGSFSVPASSRRGNRSFVAAAPQDDRGEALLRLRGLLPGRPG